MDRQPYACGNLGAVGRVSGCLREFWNIHKEFKMFNYLIAQLFVTLAIFHVGVADARTQS
jgi:hypothetical protein